MTRNATYPNRTSGCVDTCLSVYCILNRSDGGEVASPDNTATGSVNVSPVHDESGSLNDTPDLRTGSADASQDEDETGSIKMSQVNEDTDSLSSISPADEEIDRPIAAQIKVNNFTTITNSTAQCAQSESEVKEHISEEFD